MRTLHSFKQISLYGAIWADKTLIEKAHKWITEHVAKGMGVDSEKLIKSFDEFVNN